MNTRKKGLFTGLIFTVILTALDQITKQLALTFLSGTDGVELISGVFELFYLENRGAAFGMLANKQWIFILIAILMAAAAIYLYHRTPTDHRYRLLRFVCILITSGAVGNMIDRIIYHYVIDFLYFSLIDFPVFNLADCYVCIGAVLAVVSMFTVYRNESFEFLKN